MHKYRTKISEQLMRLCHPFAVTALTFAFAMVSCFGFVFPVHAEMPDSGILQAPVEAQMGLLVQTKYADLYYPEEYADAVIVVITEMEDSSLITVTTNLAEREVMLYSLILTEIELDEAEADILGWLQDDVLGTISIVLQMEEQNPDDWTEHEFMRICELQETVNELLLQLQEDLRFDSAF